MGAAQPVIPAGALGIAKPQWWGWKELGIFPQLAIVRISGPQTTLGFPISPVGTEITEHLWQCLAYSAVSLHAVTLLAQRFYSRARCGCYASESKHIAGDRAKLFFPTCISLLWCYRAHQSPAPLLLWNVLLVHFIWSFWQNIMVSLEDCLTTESLSWTWRTFSYPISSWDPNVTRLHVSPLLFCAVNHQPQQCRVIKL